MRKWLLAVLGTVIVCAVSATAAYLVLFRPAPPAAGTPAPPQTATIERTDLITKTTIDGTLGYGAATTFTGRKSGTVTWLPAPGAVVGRGKPLYSVNAQPVMLFLGDTPLYRTIDHKAAPGPDIAEVNANLRALDYPVAPLGDAYTSGTKLALKQWQQNHGLPKTGTLAVGDVAVLPAPVRVDSVEAEPGAEARTDLLGLTSTTKIVTASVDPTQVDGGTLAPGRSVTLALPHGKKAKGTVAKVSSSGAQDHEADGGAGGAGKQGKQTVTITVGNQSALSGMDSGTVGVVVTTASRKDVLVVPVGALVVVQGGSYAVQVTTGHTSKLIGVKTGMFANGLVEVSGQDITAGLKVVTVS